MSIPQNKSMTPPFTIILPVIPIGKERARVTSRGTYTPDRTRHATDEIKWLLALGKAPRFEGAIDLNVTFTILKPKSSAKRAAPTVKPDIDNMVKLFCDAANGILWKDDAQVVRLMAKKVYGGSPSIEITVRSLTTLELA